MEFGKGVISHSLDNLYKENIENLLVSKKHVRYGLPSWRETAWRGKLYRKECSTESFLNSYGESLKAVEVSSTFYSFLDRNKIENWARKVPSDFRFLPKWNKEISHELLLRNSQRQSSLFIDSALGFGEKLGTTLLQLPPLFSLEMKRELFLFLEHLPKDFPLSIEFRHPSWFDKGKILPKLQDYMMKKNLSLVCTDAPCARSVFHPTMIGHHHLIRYLSDGIVEHDLYRLNYWRRWLDVEHESGEISFICHRNNNEEAVSLLKIIAPETYAEIKEKLKGDQLSFFE